MKCVEDFLRDNNLKKFQEEFSNQNKTKKTSATDCYFNLKGIDDNKIDKSIVFLGSDKIQSKKDIVFPNLLLPMVMLFHKISSNKDKPYPSILHFYLKEINGNYTTDNNKQFIETSINNNCIFVIFHPKLKELKEHNKDKYVTSDEYKQIEDANKDYKAYIIKNNNYLSVNKNDIIKTSNASPIILANNYSQLDDYKDALSELFCCYTNAISGKSI